MRYLILILFCLTLAMAGCRSSSLTVKTDPIDASFILERSGIQGQSDATVELSAAVFAEGRKIEDNLIITKDGYQKATVPVTLVKRRRNTTNLEVISLHAVDTQLTINSSPAGAHMQFNLDEAALPEGWSRQFVTPATFSTSSDIAATLTGKLALSQLAVTGHVPTNVTAGTPLNLEPGKHTTVSVLFKPVFTTLEVMTEPEGAYVEDCRHGGFGYLGETPMRRTFTAEDICKWAERAKVETSHSAYDTVTLNLRISKPGYEDIFLDEIQIPIGERRGFKRTMRAISGRVTFSSDPEGVHVYVQRETIKTLYDERTGRKEPVKVTSKVHLGATPFTLNIDPADPLRHGEKLIWEKTGYQSVETQYAADSTGIHQVMQR